MDKPSADGLSFLVLGHSLRKFLCNCCCSGVGCDLLYSKGIIRFPSVKVAKKVFLYEPEEERDCVALKQLSSNWYKAAIWFWPSLFTSSTIIGIGFVYTMGSIVFTLEPGISAG